MIRQPLCVFLVHVLIIQIRVNGLVRPYLGSDLIGLGRPIIANPQSCHPHRCGVGAICVYDYARKYPICVCLPRHFGNPLLICVKIQCAVNSECNVYQFCTHNRCVNSCQSDTCGLNANCNVVNHISVCSCFAGYTGNPFFACTIDN